MNNNNTVVYSGLGGEVACVYVVHRSRTSVVFIQSNPTDSCRSVLCVYCYQIVICMCSKHDLRCWIDKLLDHYGQQWSPWTAASISVITIIWILNLPISSQYKFRSQLNFNQVVLGQLHKRGDLLTRTAQNACSWYCWGTLTWVYYRGWRPGHLHMYGGHNRHLSK